MLFRSGVMLKGGLDGKFTGLTPRNSGLLISGEVRGIQKVSGANGQKNLLIARNNNRVLAYKYNFFGKK